MTKVKLNLGCGFDYREGYINCDLRTKADKNFDLNKFPYPFEDDSIEEIILSHILEHLNNPVNVLEEIYRICKDKARVVINTPYFSSQSAFSDIEHKHFFTYTTLDAIDKENPIHFRSSLYKVDFKIIKKKLIWRKFLFFFGFFNLMPRIYQELFCWIFPANSITYILEAKK